MFFKIDFLVFTVLLDGEHNTDRSEENKRKEWRRRKNRHDDIECVFEDTECETAEHEQCYKNPAK